MHAHGRVPELVQRSIQVAQSGRPRPVMLSIPLDVQLGELREPLYRPRVTVAHPVPAEAELERAAQLLATARRPAIVVGGGGERAHAAVAALADLVRAPVAAAWHRKAAFPDAHPAFAGVLGFGALEATERAMLEADVVLSLGCRFSQFRAAGGRSWRPTSS